jgi:single-stranded-DNA-specific exonuclease
VTNLTHIPKKWQFPTPIAPESEQSLRGYPEILRQILFNRGYPTHEAARQFLEAGQPPNTDPENLIGMSAALDRIRHALRNQEKIAVYGDYDVDGVTSTALLLSYFQTLSADVIGYIPNRFEEGYGLNNTALKKLKDGGVDLIITVDCGIRSVAEVEFARSLGLDIIISDHHHPGEVLPNALATIDPKQGADPYPEKELAGVGIAYKIIQGLSKYPEAQGVNPDDWLDFVALGTVADLAPLVGENRHLVRQGLQRIRRPHRQGLMSLIGVSGLNAAKISAMDIGFGLGPRINAAGRLDSAQIALELLLTTDVRRAAYLAQQLEILNQERQKITRDIQAQAEGLALAANANANLLFAAHPDFNSGVVGLAAARLTDRFYRPAVVGQTGPEFTRASCRSISEFHITAALDQCGDLLEYYGGHAAAAGFTVRNENMAELQDRLNLLADEQLAGRELQPTISADVEILLSELNPKVLEYLDWLQPTGYGNPEPVFASRGLRVNNSRKVGKDQSHLKMVVSDGAITFDAIAFRLGYWQQDMPPRIDLMYNFEVNEFRGRETLQLNVRDLRPAT